MSIDISASCDGIHLRVAGGRPHGHGNLGVLTEALTASPDVSIALDEVTEFDTVGLQLLLCPPRPSRQRARDHLAIAIRRARD